MDAKFHPFKPQLFVASQRQIKIYDLAQQVLLKINALGFDYYQLLIFILVVII